MVVDADVVAVDAVDAEGDVVDADEVLYILEVLEDALHAVERVVIGHGRVGRGLHADDAAALGAGLEHVVREEALAVPEGPRAGVAEDNRLRGALYALAGGDGPAVGDVEHHADLVHALYGLAAEGGEAPVHSLADAAAEHIGLRVRDAHLAHTEAVEDVYPVELVLYGRRALENGDEGYFPLAAGALEVLHALAAEDEVLLREVAEPDAQVVYHVLELPAALGDDGAGAVHEIVEDAVEVAAGELLIGALHAALAVVVVHVLHAEGEVEGMAVRVYEDRAPGEGLHTGLLGRAERQETFLDAPVARGDGVVYVVLPRFEVIVGLIALVLLICSHGYTPFRSNRYILLR